mmetsp:Transcript_15138/g.47272  ORF Transcript_15138/g.47272 Transcript_15138/m.47272 type:complete len:230 (+) Transcript_15138:1182-1871(+)
MTRFFSTRLASRQTMVWRLRVRFASLCMGRSTTGPTAQERRTSHRRQCAPPGQSTSTGTARGHATTEASCAAATKGSLATTARVPASVRPTTSAQDMVRASRSTRRFASARRATQARAVSLSAPDGRTHGTSLARNASVMDSVRTTRMADLCAFATKSLAATASCVNSPLARIPSLLGPRTVASVTVPTRCALTACARATKGSTAGSPYAATKMAVLASPCRQACLQVW